MRLDPQGLKATSAAKVVPSAIKASNVLVCDWTQAGEIKLREGEDLPFAETPFLRAGARITATLYLGVK